MIKVDDLKVLYKGVYDEYKKGTDLDVICCLYNLEKYELLGLLNQPKIDQSEIIPILPMKKFDDNKLLLMSDIHIGSYDERPIYIDQAIDYAINNGITSIIHGGDLIHSTKKCVKKSCWRPREQALFLLDHIPYNDNINHYILFGNHDYHAFRKDENAFRIIEARNDFNILGFKRAYFTFASKLFSIMHKCDKYPLDIPNVDTFLNFYGHRHECKVEERKSVWLPTLSEDVKEYEGRCFDPGFLTMEKSSSDINIYMHSIGRDTRKILTKRYK